MSLDVKMFVVGDLEIILSKHIPVSEKMGRVRFLKKIMYFSTIYKMKALLQFYVAWVRRIEIGLKTWSDSSVEIETPMLTKFPLKPKTTSKRDYVKLEEQVWWCADYYNQTCSFSTSSHQKSVKGHLRNVRHIYRTDKALLEHPKSSSACPYNRILHLPENSDIELPQLPAIQLILSQAITQTSKRRNQTLQTYGPPLSDVKEFSCGY